MPPPLPPASLTDEPIESAEATRLVHLKHEASVRSIGLLYYLAVVFLPIAGITGYVQGTRDTFSVIASALLVILSIVYLIVGRWLRALDPRARLPATILAALGLLAFPFGTLINGYILYLLHSDKGQRIFQPDYQAIIAATPDVKYRTSRVVWALLILVIVLLAAAAIAALSTTR